MIGGGSIGRRSTVTEIVIVVREVSELGHDTGKTDSRTFLPNSTHSGLAWLLAKAQFEFSAKMRIDASYGGKEKRVESAHVKRRKRYRFDLKDGRGGTMNRDTCGEQEDRARESERGHQ